MKPIFTSYKKTLAAFWAFICVICLFSSVSAAEKPGEKSDETPEMSYAASMCLYKSQQSFGKGNIQEAINTLEAFINDPDNIKSGQADQATLHFFLGNCYATRAQDKDGGQPGQNIKQDQKKAIRCYQRAVNIDPKYCDAWLNLARCFYELENYAKAARAFEQAWTFSKEKKADHLYYAAVCRFQAQENQKALDLFGELFKHHPADITLAWKEVYVNILFSLEKYKTALPFIKELAYNIQPPKKKKWQEILLQQYLNLEMDNEALAYARELTRDDPTESKWWKGLSHIHLKKNHLKDGLSALVIYGFLTPMTESEQALAADLYFALDIPGKAALRYASLFEQNRDLKTLEKLTQALSMAHEPDQALKWVETGLRLAEKEKSDKHKSLYADLLVSRARLLYITKSWEKAAGAYEKAAHHCRKPGQAWLMAGFASLNCKKWASAETAFQKAAGYSKQKKSALAAIRQIEAMKNHNSNT